MKILVIQLARLGDIYLTWPSLRALYRQHPEAEIHMLVRERFKVATEGLGIPIKVHELKTKEILEPTLLREKLEDSLSLMEGFMDTLAAENFDRIINLSFSPFSSYLTHYLARETSLVQGYSRHPDGYLSIPDDSSAYFYAQVGIKKWNRYHLGEVLAAVCGVDLVAEDWRAPSIQNSRHLENLPSKFCLIQVSTSQEEKSYPDFKWRQVINKLVQRENFNFVLVGAPADEEIARRVVAGLPEDKVFNLVGLTDMADLFALVDRSQAVISCDSLAIQLSNLFQKPSFNLSFSSVNFWETGPRTPGSRILWMPHPDLMDSETVVREFLHWIRWEESSSPIIDRTSNDLVGFQPRGFQSSDFSWKLIEALYTGAPFPVCENMQTITGLHQLFELSELALEQIIKLKAHPMDKVSRQILEHIDETVEQVNRLAPEVRPVVAWFQTERLRMGPAPFEDILNRTRELFEKLRDICHLYAPVEEVQLIKEDLHGNADLVD